MKSKSAKPVNQIKKVLIIQSAKLGDMVCTTPLFRALKNNNPNLTVGVMGNGINQKLLASHPNVDRYLVLTKSFSANLKTIKRFAPDYIALTSPSLSNLAVAYLSGAQVVAPKIEGGISPYETKSYRLALNLVTAIPHRMGNYAPSEYLKLLEPLGIQTTDTTKTLTYSAEAKDKVANYLLNNHFNPSQDFIVIISPSAGNKIKNWGGERFAAIANHLMATYNAKVIIIGGAVDKEEITAMTASLSPSPNWINTFDQWSLDELKALISFGHLFISVDTGPVYIAEAFKVPTIDIVGGMDEREQPPRGEFHQVVVAHREAPAIHIMNARTYNESEARRQTNDITVEMVRASIDEMMAKLQIDKKVSL